MAQDGEEALQSFRQLRPDLVLLDIHLPKVDGVDVLRMIRNDSDVPVIMVTALADDVDKLLALRLGADDYVVKPFNPPEVVARVRAVLRRTQAKPAPVAAPIRVGPIEIDVEAHSAAVYDDAGQAVPSSTSGVTTKVISGTARALARNPITETRPNSSSESGVSTIMMANCARRNPAMACFSF